MSTLLDFGQTEVQIIVFKLGDEEYAIPITCIQEIIMLQETTKLPKTPAFVEGIINLRGHIIPIIDGKKKFQLDTINDKRNNDNRIIVIDIEKQTLGLIVDAVSEVVHLKKSDIEVPPMDTKGNDDLVSGIGKIKDRLLILLNPLKLLSLSETSKLSNFSKNADTLAMLENDIQIKKIAG